MCQHKCTSVYVVNADISGYMLREGGGRFLWKKIGLFHGALFSFHTAVHVAFLNVHFPTETKIQKIVFCASGRLLNTHIKSLTVDYCLVKKLPMTLVQ